MRIGSICYTIADRLCVSCISGNIENEYHFLFKCATYNNNDCQNLNDEDRFVYLMKYEW